MTALFIVSATAVGLILFVYWQRYKAQKAQKAYRDRHR